MSIAESNLALLRLVEETVFGVTPSGPPTMASLRYTGETLGQDTTTRVSDEIVEGSQVSEILRVDVQASGDVNFELSYGTYDELIEAALRSAGFSTAGASLTDDVSFAAAGSGVQVITADAGTPFASVSGVGEWVRISGFAAAANNGTFKVTAKTGTTLTVQNPNGVLAANVGGRIDFASQIVNGSTTRSFTIERENTDVALAADKFTYLRGMFPNAMSLNVTPQQIISGSFGFFGKTEQSGSATLGDGSPTAVTTTGALNAVDHVQAVFEGGVKRDITQLTMQLNNAARARSVVGELGPRSLGTGRFQPTGGLNVFFEDRSLMDKYRNFLDTSLAFVMERDGATYVFEWPRIKFTRGRQVSGGADQDIIAEMQWTAYKDAVELITMRVTRFPAA